MKDVAGLLMLALATGLAGGAVGFIYGWMCGVVVGASEKLARQRALDMKLWSFLGPLVAAAVVAGALYDGALWYNAISLGLVGWLGSLCVKGGIYWAMTRRLTRDT